MKNLIVALLLLSTQAQAQEKDSAFLHQLSEELLLRSSCYNDLRVLCKEIGHRLSGSAQAEKAVDWAYALLQKAGADTVYKQPVDVPLWVRGKEYLKIKWPRGGIYTEVPALSLGNSEGTGGKPLYGKIILVNNKEEFDRLPHEAVKGKIVFFNYRFPQQHVHTFEGYGDAAYYRVHAASLASSKGAAAALIRSVSTGEDDYPHTGSMRYADTVKKIPVMAVGNITADHIERRIRSGEIFAELNSSCKAPTKEVRSYNVIAELCGKRQPEKIVVLAGHLDSWDVGEGAHDDGAGIVQCIEVLRTFKRIDYTPDYTLRVVCFMNEENGLKGAKAYADTVKRKKEPHILAIETDAGGFVPRGFGINTKDEIAKKKIQALLPKLTFMGVHEWDGDESGADLIPLEDYCNVRSALLPDVQRYFDYHHTPNDIFENVNHRELKLGAAALAGYIYLINEHKVFD